VNGRVTERETAAAARHVPGGESASASAADQQLLLVQRAAGNAAVSRLLQGAGAGDGFAAQVQRQLAPRIARQTKTEDPPTEGPQKDPFAGTQVSNITVSLARGRVGFTTSVGMILGDITTDLKPGRYKLRPEPAKQRWVITEPAGKAGLRFEVDLEGADPWTLKYPDEVPLFVAPGQVEEPKTFGDMMGQHGLKDPLWLYEGWPDDARPKPIAGVDDLESAYYDLDYRSQGGNLSKWLRVRYRDGSLKEINLDDIRPETPKLWAAKQEALRIMDDYNALFILGTFPTVFFVLTMAPTAEPIMPNAPLKVQRRALAKPSRSKVEPEEGVPVEPPSKGGKTETPGGKTEAPAKETAPSTAAKIGNNEAFDKATAARDQQVATVKTLPKSKRQEIATVTAGTNVQTGETAAGWNQGGQCAEDVVVRKLGGDASKIRFSKAIRPRTNQEVPVCQRCQGKYTKDQFPAGTKFQDE
jgi:hypothetical protein